MADPNPNRRFRWKIPWVASNEANLVLVVAALVGIYAGLATGLFGHAINFFHLVFFRFDEVIASLAPTERGDDFRGRFEEQFRLARWHLEYLMVGGGVIAGCLVLDRVAEVVPTEPGSLDLARMRPFRTIAEVLAFGLALFYPLTLVGVFNRCFSATHANLHSLLKDTPWFVILIVPALGGLAVGFLVRRLDPGAGGHGVSDVIESVAHHGGRMPALAAIWRSLTAAITIGSGGSVGKEGPVVQIGSAVGSAFGQRFAFSQKNIVLLVGAGAAAGISSSFQAPIAGALFALEIVLRDMGISAFTPIVLASVTSVITADALLQHSREIVRAHYEMVSAFEIVPYIVLGILAGVTSMIYVRALHAAEDLFAGRRGGRVGAWLAKIPQHIKPAIGGLVLGVMALGFPRVLGTGYGTMNAAVMGELGFMTLALALITKILGTSLTLGSGGSGGSFFPAVFIGATLGGSFGTAVHTLWPDLTAVPGAYALVGMGAVVAGSTMAPLTGIVMLFEITGDYQIILPLMVTCVMASTMMHRLVGESIYTLKLAEKGISVKAPREQVLLRSVLVSQAMTRGVVTMKLSARLHEVLTLFAQTPHSTFPVVDDDGRFCGIIYVEDIRGLIYEQSLNQLVVARELMRPPTVTLRENDDLESALQLLVTSDLSALPVVARDDPSTLLGMLSQTDVLRAYGRSAARTTTGEMRRFAGSDPPRPR